MKIAKYISIFVLISAICVLMVLAIINVPKQKCESIKITPHTQNECVILSPEDLKQMMADAHIEVIGQKMKEVDLEPISNLLKKSPYVEKVNFIHFANNKLLIDYTLKDIVLRVFNNKGEQYFVDSKGRLLPYTKKMTDYLPVANGNISQSYKPSATIGKDLQSIFTISQEINKDEFCKAQFQQFYLNDLKQVELVSSIGRHIILFGDEKNAAEKLQKLKHVYRDGLTHLGFERYAQLDVRFKNRVIAQKKQQGL
ncbi:MAG: hypothetical protein K6A41_08475 [Bacteroidales bacterium]|nr:hypothetical protein [Bacteroidales bacterium]